MAHNALQWKAMSANILIHMSSPSLFRSPIIAFNNKSIFLELKLPQGLF